MNSVLPVEITKIPKSVNCDKALSQFKNIIGIILKEQTKSDYGILPGRNYLKSYWLI